MKLSIGQTLRKHRKSARKSAKDVILELKNFNINISEKTLYSYETDYRMPDADTLMTLCEIYQISNIMETFGYAAKKTPPTGSANVSSEAIEVAQAYDVAMLKDKNVARMALNLPLIEEDQTQLPKMA